MAEKKTNNYMRFDWAVKRLLRDKANFVVLESLLSALLEDQVKIVEIMESESNREHPSDKSNIVDIKAKNHLGEIIIVEVQNLYQVDFIKRILFGSSKAVIEQTSIGKDYSKISKVYCISIAHFDLGVGGDFLYRGRTEMIGVHDGLPLRLSEEERMGAKGDLVGDIMPEYFILRVNDFDEKAVTPLNEWLTYIKTGAVAEDTADPGLQRVKEILDFDKMDKEEQKYYLRYINDLNCERDSYNKALREGKEEGWREGCLMIARSLKADGMPCELIAKHTGLSLDVIKHL